MEFLGPNVGSVGRLGFGVGYYGAMRLDVELGVNGGEIRNGFEI